METRRICQEMNLEDSGRSGTEKGMNIRPAKRVLLHGHFPFENIIQTLILFIYFFSHQSVHKSLRTHFSHFRSPITITLNVMFLVMYRINTKIPFLL